MSGRREEDGIHDHEVRTLIDAVDELKKANKEQAKFNIEVVKFMASVTTWGKVGILLWTLGEAALIAILAKLV